MKKIGLIVVLFTMIATSCSKWLDVEPKTEIKSENMFESEAGFKDALIGIYLVMSEKDLYGRELTVGMLDVMGQQYDLNKDNTGVNSFFQKYDYENVNTAASINRTWNRMYYAIANINNLLHFLDEKKSILHPTHYAIIKGEALGLRAFLHFDLLKMFSFENLANNSAHLNNLSIPYVYDYDKSTTKQSTVGQVIANIRADLTAAEELLVDFDPWGAGSQGDDYYLPNDDKFYTNRAKRFNYWAVIATQARLCMWEGKSSEALVYAEKFIDNWEARTTIKWITKEVIDGDELKRDLTFSTEHIFQLNATKQFEQLKDLVDPLNAKPEKNTYLLAHTPDRASKLFAAEGASDYRWTRLYDKSENYTPLKFMEKDGMVFRNIMPIIRMTEMYYIAAECKNNAGEVKDAAKYLNVVRRSRGVANSADFGDNMTKDELKKAIETEYLKEFISEGQMFYFYKRLGYSSIPGFTGRPVYKMPLPEDEVNIAGREDINNKKEE